MVLPCDEEFLFLFRVETVGVDVVEALPEFQEESQLNGVLLERVGEDHREARLRLELAFAENGKVGGVLVEGYHRDE